MQHYDNDSVSWQMWCRLCAKEDPKRNVSIFFKDEPQIGSTTNNTTGGSENANAYSNVNLVTAIEKYFWIQINCDEKFPKMLCTECFSLITSLVNFTDRIAKVQQMYLTLQNESVSSKIDIHAIRLQYGLLNKDREHVIVPKTLPEVHYLEKVNIADECESHEEAIVNPLEPPHIINEIKEEHISEDITTGVDIGCGQDEYPYHNDNDEINNLPERHTYELLVCPKDSPEISDGEQMSTNSRLGRLERKLRNVIDETIKDSPKENERRKRRQSSSDENDGDKIESVTEDGVTAIPCTQCARTFKRTQDLGNHMARSHSKKQLKEEKVTCAQCSRTFKTRYTLKRHLTTHLPDEERKTLSCHYCEKKFSLKFLLQIHVKHVHMDERPFVCEKCGVAMHRSASLRAHMLTHTDYAPFKCEVCEKHFKDKFRLKKHMGIHGPTKHTCAECGLQLNSRDTLSRHLLVHSDKMQHKCDYCGREFKHATYLRTHLILHTGLKPYTCNFCDRTFANASNSRSHKKNAHPEEFAALEASGGGKSYTLNIPKLEALKAIMKGADNLAPAGCKQSGRFVLGKKPNIQQPTDTPAGC